MGLTQMGMGSTNNEFSYMRMCVPIIMIFTPLLIKLLNLLYDWFEDFLYSTSSNNIVSIKFPVHEVRIHKDSYKSDSSTRQLYSINYLAINDYIKDNLDKINGITNLIEILNVNMDYYSDDTNERNFVLIPSDSSEILIDSEKKIYCKIVSTEKKNIESNNNDDNIKHTHSNNNKVKTYELIIFCKAEDNTKKIDDEEKKNKMILLNDFVNNCVKKYNDKNEEKYDGKHLIYEYAHSFKDEYSGLELRFKEYLFENNKDLETNIFFEGKEKLIKYVDKFIYNPDDIKNNVQNKHELEYKSIGYTYKATFLFHGFPGCGKTSTIKAILNRTKRHGIIINWSKIKTCEELETIFRNRIINHKEYDSRELCFIIEDCDASKNNILLSRKNKEEENDEVSLDNSFDIIESNMNDINKEENNVEIIRTVKNTEKIENTDDSDEEYDKNITERVNQLEKTIGNVKKIKNKDKLDSIEKILKKMGKSSNNGLELLKSNDTDAINLSCLLNILDGIIELHGVMVIFTTNHIGNLDPAFLRPGRIDFEHEFKRSNIECIKSIVNNKFKLCDKSSDEIDSIFSQFKSYVLSPAEIQAKCFQNDDVDECIKELLKEQEKHMSRITNVCKKM